MPNAVKSKSRTRTGEEQAHIALSRYLSNGKYWHRDLLAQKLKEDGFPHKVSYVMTKARREGHVVVLGDNPGTYTSRPTGVQVLKDLRKRRKTGYAHIRNVRAVASYAIANWKKLTKVLDDDTTLELKGEIEYVQRMVPYMARQFVKQGLA